MKIVVAVRCLNEEKNIERFLHGYDFADQIIVSDGGSTDNSIKMLLNRDKVKLIHFGGFEFVNGQYWNTDAPHMNYVLDKAKEYEPDWLIFDDLDCNPNKSLRLNARYFLENCNKPQVNAFRLYLWGEKEYFPLMNNYFDPNYTSLWGWKPKEIDIKADPNVKHGTMIGLMGDPYSIKLPDCLLHYSWNPDTINEKVERYNKLGLPMNHPLTFAGKPELLPDWATE